MKKQARHSNPIGHKVELTARGVPKEIARMKVTASDIMRAKHTQSKSVRGNTTNKVPNRASGTVIQKPKSNRPKFFTS